MIYERGYIVGPMRVNWTFPYTTKELIERCNEIEAELAAKMDESLTAEQDFENDLAAYRDRLRTAGVKNWEHAMLDPDGEGVTVRRSSSPPDRRFREKQQQINKRLKEIQEFRRQLQHDPERQPDRTLKLTIDDVRFFGL